MARTSALFDRFESVAVAPQTAVDEFVARLSARIPSVELEEGTAWTDIRALETVVISDI